MASIQTQLAIIKIKEAKQFKIVKSLSSSQNEK